MSDIPTIALLVETSRGYGRGLLRGIIRWRRLHGPCNLIVSTGHFQKRLPRLDFSNCSGIIATITSLSFCDAVRRLNMPTVITEPSFNEWAIACASLPAATIKADHRSIVAMACDYFLENRYEHLAFCGIPNGWWSQERERQFVRYLTERSITPHVYPCPLAPRRAHHWEEDTRYVARWLRELPRPVAVLACNDDRGRHLLQVCHHQRIAVPHEVAVLGVDDDDLECELTQPTLSSIALNVPSTGFNAMNVLMESIRDGKMKTATIDDVPLHITERQSSGLVVTDDRHLAEALRYIRENFLFPIQVADVVEFVGISRRSLERRFIDQLGKTIRQEIQNRRLQRAKQLLSNTSDTVTKVAVASGYDNLLPMLRAFQERLHCTPTEYRRRSRGVDDVVQ